MLGLAYVVLVGLGFGAAAVLLGYVAYRLSQQPRA